MFPEMEKNEDNFTTSINENKDDNTDDQKKEEYVWQKI